MEVIRFRCPNCEKSYFSAKDELAQYEGKRVEYECAGCSTIFWLADHLSFESGFGFNESGFLPAFTNQKLSGSKSDENPDLTAQTMSKANAGSAQALEKNDGKSAAGSALVSNSVTAPSGISKREAKESQGRDQDSRFEIDRIIEFGKKGNRGESPEASERLKERWQKLLKNYERLELHDEFVSLAFDENSAAFAAFQYEEIRKICRDDPIARKMIHRIEERSLLKHSLRAAERPRRAISRVRFYHMIFLLSGAMAAIGLFDPSLRTMLALSAALFVMGVGFKWVFS